MLFSISHSVGTKKCVKVVHFFEMQNYFQYNLYLFTQIYINIMPKW